MPRTLVDPNGRVCIHCEEAASSSGLCKACYAWEYYHMSRRHGTQYMVDIQTKYGRLQRRITARLKGTKKRRKAA